MAATALLFTRCVSVPQERIAINAYECSSAFSQGFLDLLGIIPSPNIARSFRRFGLFFLLVGDGEETLQPFGEHCRLDWLNSPLANSDLDSSHGNLPLT